MCRRRKKDLCVSLIGNFRTNGIRRRRSTLPIIDSRLHNVGIHHLILFWCVKITHFPQGSQGTGFFSQGDLGAIGLTTMTACRCNNNLLLKLLFCILHCFCKFCLIYPVQSEIINLNEKLKVFCISSDSEKNPVDPTFQFLCN